MTETTIPIDAFAGLGHAEMCGRPTMKWTAYEQDVLPAWVAEMDFPLAPPIRDALIAAIGAGATGYPPYASGVEEACAEWLDRSFGLRVEPEQIGLLPDVLRGIELGIQLFSRSESPVIVTTPSYPPFFEVVQMAGRAVVEVPMAWEHGRAVFDLDAIDAAFRAGAGTLILCNPHNPLGRVFTLEELAAVAEVVERNGARVLADEVHAPLVYPGGQHVPYARVSEAAAAHSVTFTSASKGWNVPGLKCAQIILTNERDLAIWRALPYVRTHGVSILGMVAAVAAYRESGEWLREIVTYLDGNRHLLADLLGRYLPQVGYTLPEATYLAWLDCRALGVDDPAALFLERARVAFSSGVPFGPGGAGHLRLNFATSRALLTEMVERMAAAVDSAGAQPL